MIENDEPRRLDVHPDARRRMFEVARALRQRETVAEEILWRALRNRKLAGRKFRRQQPIGTYIVDFFCAAERLVVEIDGPVHHEQRDADATRQSIIESTGVRFVRLSTALVETDLPAALSAVEACFNPATNAPSATTSPRSASPPLHSMERGPGGEVVRREVVQ